MFKIRNSITQLLHFGYHQAMSCIFPVAIFGTLALSGIIDLPFIHRYDAILLILLAVQYLMYRSGLETLDEIKVICVFHIIGLLLEIYKVSMGSWAYPEPGFSKIFGVPLYSGFMYASVASFMCQIWRRLKMDMTGWPGIVPAGLLGGAIYLNFLPIILFRISAGGLKGWCSSCSGGPGSSTVCGMLHTGCR